MAGPAGDFLAAHGSDVTGQAFYSDWRERQRIEQYQDNLLMLGHSGYLETCRRAFVYCLKKHSVDYTAEGVRDFMQVYMDLQPYPDAIEGLRFPGRPLPTGWPCPTGNSGTWRGCWKTTCRWSFDAIISVDQVGAFKPSPGIYRKAVQRLEVRARGE